jgi:YbbR domain-containing protein
MKIILVLIAAVLLSINASAADDNKEDKTAKSNNTEVAYSIQTVDVQGSVIDGKSHESLAGAAIFVDGAKYYSDLEGNFYISNLKPGKHTLRVELISYQPAEMEIYLKKGQKINISLIQE